MSAPSTPIVPEARRILGLAWPVMLNSLNWTLLQATDLAVVGLTGTDQVAALGASRALTIVAFMITFGILSGVLVFASRADGAGDLRKTGEAMRDGVALALIVGVATTGVLVLLAGPILGLLGVAPHLFDNASAVTRVMAFAFPPSLVSLAISFFLEGISRPRRVMAINLTILPFNGVLAWAWSGGHFGLPALGAVGAALATLIASVFGAVGMAGAAFLLPDAVERGLRDARLARIGPAVAGAVRLLRFGIMPGFSSGLELAGFAVLIGLSTELSDTAAHAFQLVFSIHNLTFGAAIGLGSAAGVRAGNALGEGQPALAVPRTLIAVGLAALITGAMAALLMIAPGGTIAIFPATGAVHTLAAAMLFAWAPFILFDAVQLTFLYALRSLGDQVVAGVNSIIAYFLVTGGLGWWLIHRAEAGPMGLVWASGAGMLTAATLHGARFALVSSRLRRLRSSA
ncbi:MAG: MATE family efflux transporter [Pseudomonadota bacterium]